MIQCTSGLSLTCISQGYPRADVDVVAARADRTAVRCRSNDHKALTKQIDAQLELLHRLTRYTDTVT